MIIYMKYSKQGYEIAVVGESENTARYVGMNCKKVTIRTLALSGAICGIVGLILAGSINHSINTSTAQNMGFTAIMVAWLAKFNPITMIVSAFFIAFLTLGFNEANSVVGLRENVVTDFALGLVYFFVIGCEFFITYKIVFKKFKKKKQREESVIGQQEDK